MKKFTGVVLALTLCLGLAACGTEDSTGQAETPDTQAVQEAAGVSDKAVNTEKAGEDKTDKISTEVAAETESDRVDSDNTVAYVKYGTDYNVYYIIDLDNKVTRYGTDLDPSVEDGIFTEGDNLGDGISVSYNDADTDYEYSESLYLKNADDDSILILSAEDGEEYEFKKTDMSSVPYYLQ